MHLHLRHNTHTRKEAIMDTSPHTRSTEKLSFEVGESPPWHITLLSAFQLMLSNVVSMVTAAYIVHTNICPGDNDVLYAQLIATSVFMSGFCTILQVVIGVRLPVIQGSSFSFFSVIYTMMSSPKWRCPDIPQNVTLVHTISTNGSDLSMGNNKDPWKPRLLEISGSLAVASCLQVLLGCAGIVGYLTKYVGPVTIIPTISLIGLSLFPIGIHGASTQWGITALTVALVMIFTMVLPNLMVPLPVYTKRTGLSTERFPLFRLFPTIMAVCVSWLVCYILTASGVFPSDPTNRQYQARTDARADVVSMATWWYLPYPGQFGTPTFGLGTFVGMTAATLASIVESIGDYYATASVCGLPPPPRHAINRGIATEGFGSIMSGLVGACHATTSYSTSIGQIQITGVKSRIVWVFYGVLMMMCGLCGKIGAALSTMPIPITGGLFITGIGLIVAIGMSLFKHVAITTRNLMITGSAIILGLILPYAIQQKSLIIQTGNTEVDQVLIVTLSTGLFVGGAFALIMDNVIPGTVEERGLATYLKGESTIDDTSDELGRQRSTYDIRLFTRLLNRYPWCRYIPLCRSDGANTLHVDGNITLHPTIGFHVNSDE